MVSLIYFGDILRLGETVTGPDGRYIVVAVNHVFHLWYSVSLDLSSKSPYKRVIDVARMPVLLLETNYGSKVRRLLYLKEKEYDDWPRCWRLCSRVESLSRIIANLAG